MSCRALPTACLLPGQGCHHPASSCSLCKGVPRVCQAPSYCYRGWGHVTRANIHAGDNNSHLGYNDSGGRCVQFWPHTSVLGGLCCLPAWPIWVPSFSLEQSGQTHGHVNLLYSTDSPPCKHPSPAHPGCRLDLAAGAELSTE